MTFSASYPAKIRIAGLDISVTFSMMVPFHIDGEIAQLVEQWTENPRVPGSIPGLATNLSRIRSRA